VTDNASCWRLGSAQGPSSAPDSAALPSIYCIGCNAACWHHLLVSQSLYSTERRVKIHHILLIVWAIVFAMWAYKQFVAYNKKTDRE
jgi:hypothetical protein